MYIYTYIYILYVYAYTYIYICIHIWIRTDIHAPVIRRRTSPMAPYLCSSSTPILFSPFEIACTKGRSLGLRILPLVIQRGKKMYHKLNGHVLQITTHFCSLLSEFVRICCCVVIEFDPWIVNLAKVQFMWIDKHIPRCNWGRGNEGRKHRSSFDFCFRTHPMLIEECLLKDPACTFNADGGKSSGCARIFTNIRKHWIMHVICMCMCVDILIYTYV